MQKVEIKLIDRKGAKEKLTLDGAIFPSLRVTREFLLLNHLEIFACILLTSNQMIFVVQFGINKHE